MSWPTPPPLSSRDSAPRTSSTSGLRPVRSSAMTSPSPSRLGAGAVAGGRAARRTSRRAGWSGGSRRGRCRAARRRRAARSVTSASVALELDVGHLADRDVVDLDRRLRHQVEHVAELDVTVIGLLPDVGAAGQRQLVDVEGSRSAASERDDAAASDAADPSSRAAHRVTSTRPPRVGSMRSCAGAARRRRPSAAGARPGRAGLLDQVADLPPVSAWSTSAHRTAAGSAGAGCRARRCWRGCRGCRPAGCRSGTGCSARPARPCSVSSRARALLDQDLGDPVEALDVAGRATSRFSFDEAVDTWVIATREVAQRRRRGPGARRRAGRRTSASESLNWRTVSSFSARVLMNPSSCGRCRTARPCCRRASVSLPRFFRVWLNCTPWPPKFVGRRVEQVGQRARRLVGAVGPERDGEVVEAAEDLVELQRGRGAVGAEVGVVGQHRRRRCTPASAG